MMIISILLETHIIPFCGLVETLFNLSYTDYQALIEKELACLYDVINDYLGFNLLLK